MNLFIDQKELSKTRNTIRLSLVFAATFSSGGSGNHKHLTSFAS